MTNITEMLRRLADELYDLAKSREFLSQRVSLNEVYKHVEKLRALAVMGATQQAQRSSNNGPCLQCGDAGMVDYDAEGFAVGMVPCPECPSPQQLEVRVIGWVEKLDAGYDEIHRLYGEDGRKLVQRIPFGYPVAILPTGINNWHAQPEAQADNEDFHDVLYNAKVKLCLDPENNDSIVKLQVGASFGSNDNMEILLHAVDEEGKILKLYTTQVSEKETPPVSDRATYLKRLRKLADEIYAHLEKLQNHDVMNVQENQYHWGWLIDGKAVEGAGCNDPAAIPLFAHVTSHQQPEAQSAWPTYLMLRDTKLHDDIGGGGQRIFTTAGAGYKKVKYVRYDLATPFSNAIPEEWMRDREQVENLATHLESIAWRPNEAGDVQCYDQAAAMSADVMRKVVLPMIAATQR